MKLESLLLNNNTGFILGLTGSIAMGKTTVSNMFRDLGVQVWCADNEVNELYKKNGAATKVFSKEFPSVITKTGVDKKKLRNLIHKDNAILKKVERIVHPLLEHSKVDFVKSNKVLSRSNNRYLYFFIKRNFFRDKYTCVSSCFDDLSDNCRTYM